MISLQSSFNTHLFLMDLSQEFLFIVFLILAAAIHGNEAYSMVTGTVFCDQCKDGERSLFDYPIYGIKVMMACADSSGQITMSSEETTNWIGNYAMRFDGTPDLSNCYAQVLPSTGGDGSMGCGVGAGPAQKLRLMFRMFGMEMYAVDSLLSQPAQPMSFCPKSANPLPSPPTPVRPVPEPVTPVRPSPEPVTPVLSPPNFRLPPLPPLPPMPPLPFLEASACSHQYWTMPQYRCYWRAVNPETKVAIIFGVPAAQKYGNDITLWQALQGRGDPYKTLLREATTALLNSYNSLLFPYHTLDVVTHMNWALMGSQRSVLITGLRFLRANSGSANVTCKFTPCH